MSEDHLFERMIQPSKELQESIISLVNLWMQRSECKEEPEIALGMMILAACQAVGEYTATHRFANGYSPEWSEVCVNAAQKVLENSHYAEIKELENAKVDPNILN